MSVNNEMRPRQFPAEVLARLAPQIFFERHFAIGERPNGRKFVERRTVEVRPGDPNSLPGSLGSAVVRAGSASVVCGITAGLTRFIGEGGVYANVEIHRGGLVGKPTSEAQVLTTRVHRLLQTAKLPRSNFEVNEEYELCLNAQIIVLSRTGPMLDLVWECLVAALQNTKVPELEVDERTLELVPTGSLRPLELPPTLADQHRSFGIVDNVVLADIDGAVEEECVTDRLSFARSTETGKLSSLSILTPNGVNIETIEEALRSN